MRIPVQLVGLIVVCVASAAQAQTISIGQFPSKAFCNSESVTIPYSFTGSFNSDNYFALQRSDTAGSFANFTIVARDTTHSGQFRFQLYGPGLHWRYRVISSDPYMVSPDNGTDVAVVDYPVSTFGPDPTPDKQTIWGPIIGLTGDTISFHSGKEPAIQYLWDLGSGATNPNPSGPTAVTTYATPGFKTVTLYATNIPGCTAHDTDLFYVGSCSPIIPKNARVVTGAESGADQYVWVKTGGDFLPNRIYGPPQTIFLEPGAALEGSLDKINVYMKPGSVYKSYEARSGIVLQRGITLTLPPYQVDTFCCDNLQFDYSQVNAGVTREQSLPTISISQSSDRVVVTGLMGNSTLSLFNVLGYQVLPTRTSYSPEERIDISHLPNGSYYLRIETGGLAQTRKLVVAR